MSAYFHTWIVAKLSEKLRTLLKLQLLPQGCACLYVYPIEIKTDV